MGGGRSCWWGTTRSPTTKPFTILQKKDEKGKKNEYTIVPKELTCWPLNGSRPKTCRPSVKVTSYSSTSYSSTFFRNEFRYASGFLRRVIYFSSSPSDDSGQHRIQIQQETAVITVVSTFCRPMSSTRWKLWISLPIGKRFHNKRSTSLYTV